MRDKMTFLVAACGLALLTALPASGQVISISPQSYDFGTMKQQESRTTFIEVTNKGDAELVLGKVDADCGCTVPTVAKSRLAPGETTQIEVRFDSKKENGLQHKTVRIQSNDPQNPLVEFMILADVKTALVIDPASQRIGFARVLIGGDQTGRVTFTATERDLEISVDETRKGVFEVRTLNQLDGDRRQAALEVVLPADTPAGRYRDNVSVKTNIPDFERVNIEVSAWRYDKLEAQPEEVNFRYKTSFKQNVRVAPTVPGTEFKITGAEIDLPEIAVEVDETIPNRETMVRLRGTPIAPDDPRATAHNGRIEGTLTIHTNLADVPTLTVPVRYMVRL